MRCPRCQRTFGLEYKFCPYDGRRLRAARQVSGAAPLTSQAGQVLGKRYRIIRFLAAGAMARVYLAEDRETGAPVAVKMLEEVRNESEELRQRFAREARAVEDVGHPNIVRIHDTGESPLGIPYLVMEYLMGEPLGTLLQRERKITADAGLPILRQAASALWVAHDRGMVHRDLKPDNLFLVGERGKRCLVKLLDFGLSKMFQSRLTMAGTVIGTPAYMAPEQVVAETTDQRTDVYGLGLVMYRMFAGRLPFVAPDHVEKMVACQLLVPPPPPSRYADIDPRIERVILTALHKRPERRYPSMRLFADDLRKLETPHERLFATEAVDEPYDTESSPVTRRVAAALQKILDDASP